MPIDWVIGGMGAIITALVTTVGILWRNHLQRDADLKAENAELRGIAGSASSNIGALVPAVRDLTTGLEAVDVKAVERYEQIRKDVREFRDEHHRDLIDVRPARRGARG